MASPGGHQQQGTSVHASAAQEQPAHRRMLRASAAHTRAPLTPPSEEVEVSLGLIELETGGPVEGAGHSPLPILNINSSNATEAHAALSMLHVSQDHDRNFQLDQPVTDLTQLPPQTTQLANVGRRHLGFSPQPMQRRVQQQQPMASPGPQQPQQQQPQQQLQQPEQQSPDPQGNPPAASGPQQLQPQQQQQQLKQTQQPGTRGSASQTSTQPPPQPSPSPSDQPGGGSGGSFNPAVFQIVVSACACCVGKHVNSPSWLAPRACVHGNSCEPGLQQGPHLVTAIR